MAIDPNLITTTSVGELPDAPLLLTSLIAHETVSDSLLKKVTIQDLVDFIAPLVTAIQYQVITLHVDSTYIEDNFDETGLGTNLMVGYAICNGQNGTINKDGRVGIAYGSTYNAVGAIGGDTTHTLTEAQMPQHSHTSNGSASDNGDPGNYALGAPTDGGATFTIQTSSKGSGEAHNNMQPYLVELQIMKL